MSARAEVWSARLPLARTFVSAANRFAERDVWLLRLVADDAEGWGELSVLGADPGAAVDALVAAAARLTSGDAPEAPTAGWQDTLEPAVRAAVVTALLDVSARRAGVLLAQTLEAGAVAEVACNGLVGDGHPSLRRLAIADLVRRGFGTIKLKVGAASWCNELDLLEETATLHRGLRLRLDPNMGWAREDLGPRLGTLGGLGVEYVEQPLPVEHLDDLLNVETKSGVGVAFDEALVDRPEALQQILASSSPQTLVLKPAWLGGPDRALTVAWAAVTRGHRVVVTTTLESSIGRAMAVQVAAAVDAMQPPGVHGLATGDLFERDVDDAPVPSTPRIAVRGPGLGHVPCLDRLTRLA